MMQTMKIPGKNVKSDIIYMHVERELERNNVKATAHRFYTFFSWKNLLNLENFPVTLKESVSLTQCTLATLKAEYPNDGQTSYLVQIYRRQEKVGSLVGLKGLNQSEMRFP